MLGQGAGMLREGLGACGMHMGHAGKGKGGIKWGSGSQDRVKSEGKRGLARQIRVGNGPAGCGRVQDGYVDYPEPSRADKSAAVGVRIR